MKTCVFCDQPSYTGDYTDPVMCHKHFDLILLASRLLRFCETVTVEGLEQIFRDLPPEIRIKLSFNRKEIAGLFSQAKEKGFDLAYRPNGARVLVGKRGSDGNTD
jgi:hypothetical protein